MIQCRIYTQDKHRRWLFREVSKHFKHFTAYSTVGFYKGGQRKLLVIEILSAHAIPTVKFSLLCKAICGYNRQQNVVVTISDCDVRVFS